mgnify:CR=1 FL=1
MTYVLLSVVVLALLAVVTVPTLRRLPMRPLLLTALVLIALTAVFDNIIVGLDIVDYDDDPAKLEEERRLAYVAITRARKRLFLTYAATRRTYGSTQANPRSRFVNEIPAENIEFSGIGSSGFEGTGWEKRGDRRGTFGSGQGSDMYGGRVFGSCTRSTPGTPWQKAQL